MAGGVAVVADHEEVEVLLLDGVDGREQVPVDLARAGRGRDRTGVDLAVVGVDGLDEVAVLDEARLDGEVGRGGVVVVEVAVEEGVDGLYLGVGDAGRVLVDVEDDAERGGDEVAVGLPGGGLVDGVDLEVEAHVVDGVLGALVPVELLCLVLGGRADFCGVGRGEAHGLGGGGDVVGGAVVDLGRGRAGQVLVRLREGVGVLLPRDGLRRDVDRRLPCFSAFVRRRRGIEVRPVQSVEFVIKCGL